jgi:hypothetical protein
MISILSRAFRSRDQFVEGILGCGLLIFLSPIWLDEVYNTIREIDVFGFGLNLTASGSLPASSLKNVLSDLDGFGATFRGARLLSDFRRLGKQHNSSKQMSVHSAFFTALKNDCFFSGQSDECSLKGKNLQLSIMFKFV